MPRQPIKPTKYRNPSNALFPQSDRVFGKGVAKSEHIKKVLVIANVDAWLGVFDLGVPS